MVCAFSGVKTGRTHIFILIFQKCRWSLELTTRRWMNALGIEYQLIQEAPLNTAASSWQQVKWGRNGKNPLAPISKTHTQRLSEYVPSAMRVLIGDCPKKHFQNSLRPQTFFLWTSIASSLPVTFLLSLCVSFVSPGRVCS